MDGYLQAGLGILVSLILFLIGYRQTIGAKKERVKNANHSIHRSIMRRMVLENYAPLYIDISRLIEGKAREFFVSPNTLLSEEQVLNSLYTEVFDSDLISPSQRVEIEQRLNRCLEKIEEEPLKPSFEQFQQLKSEKSKMRDSLAAMVLSTSVLGALATVLFNFIETKTINYDWLLSGVGVLVSSIAILTTLIIFRKNKEIEIISSKRSVQLTSSVFEAEIAKILKKNNIDFIVEPDFGDIRPDFLLKLSGKSIAIEAKAWDGPVPLHNVRRTLNYLNKLSQTGEVDSVILVTSKQTQLPISKFDSGKISVVPLNELASYLKAYNKANSSDAKSRAAD